jgi:hypothetical protein
MNATTRKNLELIETICVQIYPAKPRGVGADVE